jgi:hypothetical protein
MMPQPALAQVYSLPLSVTIAAIQHSPICYTAAMRTLQAAKVLKLPIHSYNTHIYNNPRISHCAGNVL